MGKFNNILADLAKRQLQFDFKLEGTPYEGQMEIGVGAFGIVCEAIDTRSASRVAIKKIGHASATPTLARRTLREVRCLRYIYHDNIVPLLDMFQAPGPLGNDIYLVMELMEGSLHSVIRSNQVMEPDLVAYFLYQILRGLR
uniref:Protein kinase domain-containing protein n=1 Tax=Plectus sambesii TaxID=2011161 RepID=A0A914UTZ6_9BILA